MKPRTIFAYFWVILPILAVVTHYAWSKKFLREDRLWDGVKVALSLEERAQETMAVEDWEAAELRLV